MIEIIIFLKENIPRVIFSLIFGSLITKCIIKKIKNEIKYYKLMKVFKYELDLLYKESINLNLNGFYDMLSLKPVNISENISFSDSFDDMKEIRNNASKYNELVCCSNVNMFKNNLDKIIINSITYYYLSDDHKPKPCFQIFGAIINLQKSIKLMITNNNKKNFKKYLKTLSI